MPSNALATLATQLNGGATINATLLFQLLNLAKAMVEERRPWMILRNTDASVPVAAGGTWQTPLSIAAIPRFSRFYGERPVKLFDGQQNYVDYCQVPFNQRLANIQNPGTFVLDEGTSTLYLNGTAPMAGTLFIDHIKHSPDITPVDAIEWIFPAYAHPLLAFMAIGIHKGGIDYDDVNARMAPDNRAQAELIIQSLTKWDTEKQLTSIEGTDPSMPHDNGYRSGAIRMS